MSQKRRNVPALPDFVTLIAFQSIDPASNRYRSYRIQLEERASMWVVMTWRGRIGGTEKLIEFSFPTEQTAREEAHQRGHDRLLHGYCITEVDGTSTAGLRT